MSRHGFFLSIFSYESLDIFFHLLFSLRENVITRRMKKQIADEEKIASFVATKFR